MKQWVAIVGHHDLGFTTAMAALQQTGLTVMSVDQAKERLQQESHVFKINPPTPMAMYDPHRKSKSQLKKPHRHIYQNGEEGWKCECGRKL